MMSLLALVVVQSPLFWVDAGDTQPADSRYAFRGTFELSEKSNVELKILAAPWFNASLDGKFLTEGPARFSSSHPQYEVRRLPLGKGKHVLAIEVQNDEISTRLLEKQQPFVYSEVSVGGSPVPISWKGSRVGGFSSKVRRINPQLGWIEWCDTRQVPDWKAPNHVDEKWSPVVNVTRPLGELRPLDTAPVALVHHAITPMAQGEFSERYGYESDDPSVRFFLRELGSSELPSQGIWRRYDLGYVAVWRPSFELDLPRGSVVEFAYSEALTNDRVSPWITLSGGTSCNLDHYVAKGGRQVFQPLTPRGGRFVEVHIFAPKRQVKFLREEFIERTYYPQVVGEFRSVDPLLNKIWNTGARTSQSCVEDSPIDNPTRERGQWAGADLAVGLENASFLFTDLRPYRRALVHCAENAREDGMVAGMSPGQKVHLSSYAAMWPTACLAYFEKTGDRTVLTDLWSAAKKNIASFENARTPAGIPNSLGWGFVDWGYVESEGPCDVGLNLHYLEGLRAMSRWALQLGEPDPFAALEQKQRTLLTAYFRSGKPWDNIGFHRAVLGLRMGLVEPAERPKAVEFLKKHMLGAFPNSPSAPRLADPSTRSTQLITPFFSHFVMPALIEAGEMNFVLDQYRKCWGWMLSGGRTTWVEVFDTRWSHCHGWSGCPTWQLSAFALGLRP